MLSVVGIRGICKRRDNGIDNSRKDVLFIQSQKLLLCQTYSELTLNCETRNGASGAHSLRMSTKQQQAKALIPLSL